MVDAQLMVEAVTDASKGGESAYNAWMAAHTEQMHAMRAARLGGSLSVGTGSADSTVLTPGASTAMGEASEQEAAPTDAVEPSATTAASALAAAPAGGGAAASAAPFTNGAVPECGGGPPDAGELTLSQLAAWNVGDVLLRAGLKTPQPDPARAASE